MLNSLKCPICKAPIDICSKRTMIYNYGCAINADHYSIYLVNWEPIVRIETETVNIYDKNHKYSISKLYNFGDISTVISVYETDLENRVIFSFKEKRLVLDNSLFDFNNFDKDKALNRIKTIFVFH